MIRRSVDYRQDLTNHIRLCKFLVGDTPNVHIHQHFYTLYLYIYNIAYAISIIHIHHFYIFWNRW